MLRTLFVLILVMLGAGYALTGAFGGLLFYLWFAYFRPDYWVWNQLLVRALNLSLIVGVYTLGRTVFSASRFRFDLRSWLLLAMLVLSFLSAEQSADPAWSMFWWTDFAKNIAIVYLISILVDDPKKLRLTMIVIAFSLGFEAVKQGWGGLILHPGGVNNNRLPMLGDNNGVAVGMLMLVMLFIALAHTAATTWEKRLHQFFVVGVAYRAITTYSRGAFLSGTVLAIVYIMRSKHKVRALVGAAVVATVVALAMPSTFWERMSTIHTSEEELEEDSSRGRIHFWRVAVEMANAHPLFGIGHNAYQRVYDNYDFSDGYYGHRRSVHSAWFGILSELGYPAFVVYLAILLAALHATGQVVAMARRGEVPEEFYHYGVTLQTAFVACSVGASFVPFQYVDMWWHFIGLTMALLAVAKKIAAERVPAPVPAPLINPAFRPAVSRAG